MKLKKIILSTNIKLENKFNSLNKISKNMLIFGQFFLVMTLSVILFYAACLSPETRIMLNIFNSVRLLFESAASGLFILWLCAIFLDYIDKSNNS